MHLGSSYGKHVVTIGSPLGPHWIPIGLPSAACLGPRTAWHEVCATFGSPPLAPRPAHGAPSMARQGQDDLRSGIEIIGTLDETI